MKPVLVAIPFLLATMSVLGCGSGGGGSGVDKLPACPSGGTQLTYDNFGKAFFDSYCNTCHASNSTDRQGAPSKITFDSADEIASQADEIYSEAGSSNTIMPPSDAPDQPSADERTKLTEWLSCGAK